MGGVRGWVPTMFVAVVILAFAFAARGDYGEDETWHKCGGGKYSLSDSYNSCVNFLLNDLVRQTPEHGYNYAASSNYMGTNCYGYGACDGSLPRGECSQCITDACSNLLDKSECKFRVRGKIKLAKCQVGYQDSPLTDA